MKVGRRRVSVIRVYESTDTPHIVRGTGSVFVRDPGAKRPLRSHDELVALARRGEHAARVARERLSETAAVAYLLRTPDSPYWAIDHAPESQATEKQQAASTDQAEPDLTEDAPLPDIRIVARAAPLTITPTVRDWPLTRAAGNWVLERVDELVPSMGLPGMAYPRLGPVHESFGRAIGARVTQETGISGRDEAVVVVDCAGVVGAQIYRGAHRGDRPSILLQAMLDDELIPLAKFVAETLDAAEAYGRAVAELWLLLPPKGYVAGAHRDHPREMRAVRELTIPADEEDVRELAEAWHREIQRAVGIVKYEGEEA